MNKPIYRYGKRTKELAGAKIEPEPWMHLATVRNKYVIFVWDTRQILESGDCNSIRIMTNVYDYANDNGKPLEGEGAELFNELLFVKDFKVTVKKWEDKWGHYVDYYVGDICVCKTRKYWDAVCSVHNGMPSRLRDKYGWCKQTDWQHLELGKLFRTKDYKTIEAICRETEDCANSRWGYFGSMASKKDIVDTLNKLRAALA